MTLTVSARGLTMEYVDGDSHLRPLDGFDLEAQDGELVILLGPSGSGKTTLLSCLAGLLTPTAGTVTVLGKDVTALDAADRDRYRRDTVGVVFQAFNLLSSLTAQENVAIPLRLAKRPRAESKQRAVELLEQVGLGHRLTHKPSQLSGGQQQRVAIARALALDPPVVLADEPTAHLDVVQVEGVITLLRSLASPGRTIIVSTHDERLIPLADRVVELGELAPPTESRELAVAAGEVVFEEGSRGRHVYVLTSGAIEIVKLGPDGHDHLIKVVSAGTYFGEMGPLLNLPRSATARALVDSVVQQYDVRDFRHTLGTAERERLSVPT